MAGSLCWCTVPQGAGMGPGVLGLTLCPQAFNVNSHTLRHPKKSRGPGAMERSIQGEGAMLVGSVAPVGGFWEGKILLCRSGGPPCLLRAYVGRLDWVRLHLTHELKRPLHGGIVTGRFTVEHHVGALRWAPGEQPIHAHPKRARHP